jgi:hypothetical protein
MHLSLDHLLLDCTAATATAADLWILFPLTYCYCLAAAQKPFHCCSPAVLLLLLLYELQPCVCQLLQPVLADRQLQLGCRQSYVGQVLRLCTPEHTTRTHQQQVHTGTSRSPAAAAAAAATVTAGVSEGRKAPQDVGNLP